ncbi:diguanylate cyclase [Acidiphilium sp.]|uniref:diguanylate cyclase n=1 Tax=Acidiphilium sp. TaxID=527 RepID=UPI003D01467F
MTARVLIVDDIAPNARLLEVRLTSEYYEVKTVNDSRDALAIAQVWQPDVILLDVMMPGLNGFDLSCQIKSLSSTAHIPIIMITGLNHARDRAQGLQCGADEFLTKPIHYELLLARLRGIIRFKRLRDEWRGRGATAMTLGLTIGRPDDISHHRARALVVDDLTTRGMEIQQVLSAANIDVIAARNEAEVYDHIRGSTFDLMVISLSLLGVDPLRLVARCRAWAESRDTPLLLIAEPDQRDIMIHALDLGANDCLILPLDADELTLRANNQIRHKLYEESLRNDVGSALKLAVIDPLTQLYNRRYLSSHLERLCDDPSGSGFAVMIVDIDHFKTINDQFGHLAGDKVLQRVADILRRNLRTSDLIARFGGEEFVVIINGLTDERRAAAIAEKLRSTIEALTFDFTTRVTASVGVTLSRPPASAEALLGEADAALYDAKRAGRNLVSLYRLVPDHTPSLSQEAGP